MRVAIVCDWLIGGGAEKVVEQLHKMYPEAPIYASTATHEWRERLNGKVITGYLNWWPLAKLRKFLPLLRILWFRRLDLSKFDQVISSSGAEAKFVTVESPAIHVSYIHAPTHYYWRRYDEYIERPGFGKLDWLARFGLELLVGPLRKMDYRAAQTPDYLIANSSYTQSEIKKYYQRDSTVIFPPVDTERFGSAKSDEPRSGFVIAGRQTPYKRFDIAVEACTKLKLPLIVIGTGPDNFRLKRLAGRSVTFIRASDEDMPLQFARAEAFLFPGVDDFGVVAVEAMAAGTPVIAYKGGGAVDYVKPGKTGEFFAEQTTESLAKTLQGFHSEKFNESTIKKFASSFSVKHFRVAFQQFIKSI